MTARTALTTFCAPLSAHRSWQSILADSRCSRRSAAGGRTRRPCHPRKFFWGTGHSSFCIWYTSCWSGPAAGFWGIRPSIHPIARMCCFAAAGIGESKLGITTALMRRGLFGSSLSKTPWFIWIPPTIPQVRFDLWSSSKPKCRQQNRKAYA